METVTGTAPTPPAAPVIGPADRWMRRILRLPPEPVRKGEGAARKAMQTSLLVSMIRCSLQYLFLPIAGPALGLASDVAAPVGIAIALFAIVALVTSVRRFFGAHHRKRWHYTALAGVVCIAMTVLLVRDVLAL